MRRELHELALDRPNLTKREGKTMKKEGWCENYIEDCASDPLKLSRHVYGSYDQVSTQMQLHQILRSNSSAFEPGQDSIQISAEGLGTGRESGVGEA